MVILEPGPRSLSVVWGPSVSLGQNLSQATEQASTPQKPLSCSQNTAVGAVVLSWHHTQHRWMSNYAATMWWNSTDTCCDWLGQFVNLFVKLWWQILIWDVHPPPCQFIFLSIQGQLMRSMAGDIFVRLLGDRSEWFWQLSTKSLKSVRVSKKVLFSWHMEPLGVWEVISSLRKWFASLSFTFVKLIWSLIVTVSLITHSCCCIFVEV